MLFRQLFDPETSTYTYLLADEDNREAVVIDSVREQVDRDVQLIGELGLTLRYALETHVHADHVTGSGRLRERLGCRVGVGAGAKVVTADLQLYDENTIGFGRHLLEVRETPGHTSGCVTFVSHAEGMAFTGDALLVRGCGRTDFQQGDAHTLYRSVRERILTLVPETRLYPAHDYQGRTVTTVAEEKRFNRRLSDAHDEAAFVAIMDALDLAYPGRIDEAVPANMASGITEPEPLVASDAPEDAWAPLQLTASGVPVVEAAWVDANRARLRLVDVREHLEFCGSLGHIEGAELCPAGELEAAAKGWDRDAPLVLVCAWGTRSGKAARRLRDEGYQRVASLHGGMVRWTEEGHTAVEVLGDRSLQDDPQSFQGAGI